MQNKTENKDNQNPQTSMINKNLIKNISILTSLLLFSIVIMIIINHYEKQDLPEGGKTSTAQILGS